MNASLTAQKKRHDAGNGDAWLRGGQTVAHTYDMIMELGRKVSIIVIVWLLICWGIANNAAPDEDQVYAGLWFVASIYTSVGKPFPDSLSVPDLNGESHTYLAKDYFHIPYAVSSYDRYFGFMWMGFWFFLLGCVAIIAGLSIWFINHGHKKLEATEVRGQQIVELTTLFGHIRKFNAERVADINRATLISMSIAPASITDDAIHRAYLFIRAIINDVQSLIKPHEKTFDVEALRANGERYNNKLDEIRKNTDLPHKLLSDERWVTNELYGFEQEVLYICGEEAKKRGLPFYPKPSDYKAPTIAKVPYPFGAHLEHTLLCGGTGSGKSVAIHQMIDSIKDRGDCAMIYDPEGEFIRCHFRPGIDRIFNPFDVRSVGWSPYKDLKKIEDWQSAAADLFPEPKSADPYWINATRQIFAYAGNALGLKYRALEGRVPTIMELLSVLTGPQIELFDLIKDTPAGQTLGEKSGPRSDSLRSVLVVGVERLAHLLGTSEDFSIKEWINDPTEKGFLFLSSPESLAETIRPILAHVSSLAITALLSRTPDESKKETWIILDEFNSLGKMDKLADAPARLRKFGGAMVIGMQQVSQLEETYGEPKMRTIVGQLRNKLILGCNDPRTGEFMSELLGEREVIRIEETTSYGANNIRDGVGLAPKTTIEPIAMPEQIMKLPSREGYIMFSPGSQGTSLPVSLIKYNYIRRDTLAKSFIPHDRPNLIDQKFLSRVTGTSVEPIEGRMVALAAPSSDQLVEDHSQADTEHEPDKQPEGKRLKHLAPSQSDAVRSAPQTSMLESGSNVDLGTEDIQAVNDVKAARAKGGQTLLQGLNDRINNTKTNDEPEIERGLGEESFW